MIGIILLIGIVKKNGIMLVDFALETERNEGLSPMKSIYQGLSVALPADLDDDDGGAAWLRLPLMLGNGTGAEIRQPLGYTIVGGLALSQVLTLFTTPSFIFISTA